MQDRPITPSGLPLPVTASEALPGWRPAAPGRVRSITICHFDIVSGCQLSCIGCPNSTLHPRVHRISREDFRRCLANIDVRTIAVLRLFNFGEPLLHDDLAGLLEEISNQRWSVGLVEISTNAQFVDWPAFEAALRTGLPGRLVVSCDGDGTAEDYERLRPPSRWERLIEFLTRAAELRNRIRPNLDLVTRTICVDAEGQARWRALLEPLGWYPEFRPWIDMPEASRSPQGAPRPLGLCQFRVQPNLLYVAADGSVVPCCFHPRASVLGNLKEETFNAIMDGKLRQRFSAAMAEDRAAMPICGACPAGSDVIERAEIYARRIKQERQAALNPELSRGKPSVQK